jgi:hypothetical protein
MQTIDYRAANRDLLTPKPGKVELVKVPPMRYLMLDGKGDPNHSEEYHGSFAALYGLAYGLKFHYKKQENIDYNLLAIEGLWWTEPAGSFSMEQRENWLWTMMLSIPEFIPEPLIQTFGSELMRKKSIPQMEQVYTSWLEEGECFQIMHIGPYAAEPPTIQFLHSEIQSQGYTPRGKHHEIYLGDPRKSSPEKLKTILRQPVSSIQK